MMAWTLLLPQWFWDNLLPWAEQRLQMIASCRIGVCTWIEGLATRAMGTRKSVPFTSWSWSSTVGGALGCFIALHLVLLWNLREDPGYLKMYENPKLQYLKRWPCYLSKKYNPLVRTLRIDQKWGMFAPYPVTDDGWYVIEGETIAGTKVDVLLDSPDVQWDKPERVAQTFPHARWRKYLFNIWKKKNQKHRLYYGNYLTRKWEREHPVEESLKSFKIYYVKEKTLPDGREADPVPNLIWSHDLSLIHI